MNEKFQQKVITTKKTITVITFLPYGNLYRVKYVKTDKDIEKTHVLETFETSYNNSEVAKENYLKLIENEKDKIK